jgi:sugar phosphate isomerase/epimerase
VEGGAVASGSRALERICVCEAGFDRAEPLQEHLERYLRLGIRRAGLVAPFIEVAGWESSIQAVRDSGLEVAYLLAGPLFSLADPSTWEAERRTAMRWVDAASELGADRMYGVTGPSFGLEWEQASAAFAAAIEPLVAYARERQVELLLEPTNPVFVDLNLPHTLRDTVAVARRAGIGVCFDIHHVWTERNLRETVADAAGLIGLVQVADYVPGSRGPTRAAPGDGVIPLERIFAWLLDDGYKGVFDLELSPDRDDADFIRGAAHVCGLLDGLEVARA